MIYFDVFSCYESTITLEIFEFFAYFSPRQMMQIKWSQFIVDDEYASTLNIAE